MVLVFRGQVGQVKPDESKAVRFCIRGPCVPGGRGIRWGFVCRKQSKHDVGVFTVQGFHKAR